MAAKSVVMVVDDEAPIRELIREILQRAGHDVVEAADAEQALAQMQDMMPDLMLVDWKLPKLDGMCLLQEARRLDPCLSMIMVTAQASVDAAVEAMRRGASDFIAKPFNVEQLQQTVGRTLEGQALRREVFKMRSEQTRRHGAFGSLIISASQKMSNVYRIVRQVAKSPATTVLIQGESGTGKELVAKAIHLSSERRNKRFVDINCAALTETLLEAEIFGYEKGAFTGAVSTGKQGLFEAANGGTIFLDEIGEMSLPLQAKLLRVLQEKRFKRVGGLDDIEVDVRIVASTNRDLEQLVQEGKFRLDLFYRLRVVPILLPPLRDRREDILPIAQHYVELLSKEIGKPICELTPAAASALDAHDWPGNVRELKNVIERAVVMTSDDRIDTDDLVFSTASQPTSPRTQLDLTDLSLAGMEKQLIRKVLENTSWRRAEAARVLGINRTTLYNKIREYELMPRQS